MISNSADWDWDLEIDCTVCWICTKHHIEYSKRKKSVPDLQIVAMTKRNRLSILYYSNPRYFDRFAQSFGLLQKDSLDARKSHGFI